MTHSEQTSEDAERALARISGLVELFGEPIENVDQILLRMAIGPAVPPLWLRNISKIEQTPRYDGGCADGAADMQRVELTGLTAAEFADRLAWIIDNLADGWCLKSQIVWLASIRDSVHYHMRWSPP
jgi:hypothetical protein